MTRRTLPITPARPGRPRKASLDELATEISRLPKGQMLPLDVPFGRDARAFRNALVIACQRRGLEIMTRVLSARKIAVFPASTAEFVSD